MELALQANEVSRRPALSSQHTAASAPHACPANPAACDRLVAGLHSIRDTIMHSRYLVVVLSALSQYAHAFGSMPRDPCDRCPPEQCMKADNLLADLLKEECSGCTACHGLCPAQRACVAFYGDRDGGRARDAWYCPDGFMFRASHQSNRVDDSKSDCFAFSKSDAECTGLGGTVGAVFQCS